MNIQGYRITLLDIMLDKLLRTELSDIIDDDDLLPYYVESLVTLTRELKCMVDEYNALTLEDFRLEVMTECVKELHYQLKIALEDKLKS